MPSKKHAFGDSRSVFDPKDILFHLLMIIPLQFAKEMDIERLEDVREVRWQNQAEDASF